VSNALEYILLALLVTFVAFKVFKPMGEQVNDKLQSTANQIERLTR